MNARGPYKFTRHICLNIHGRVHAETTDDASSQADDVMMGAACALRDLYAPLGISVEPQAEVKYATTYSEAADD